MNEMTAAVRSAGRQLRILLLLETSSGGSGKHAQDLAEGLAGLGHDVTMVYSPIRADGMFLERLADAPYASVSFDMRRSVGLHDFRAFIDLLKLLAKLGPFDILHAHSSKAGALLRALPLRGAKVYTPHAFKTMDQRLSLAGKLSAGLIESLLGNFATNRLIAVSHQEAEHAVRGLRIARRRVDVVYNGVKPLALRDRESARRELGIDPSTLLVGFIGRLTYQKNPELFLAAVKTAVDRGLDVSAVMLGDGDLREKIEQLIPAMGLASRVQLVSGRKATEFLAAMDCLVMTSRYEAMPYTLLEALSVAVPVITTPIGGDELIRPGENGLIVQPDPLKLADAMAEALGRGELRERVSKNASHAQRAYSCEAMVQATMESYASALQGSGSPRPTAPQVFQPPGFSSSPSS